MERLLNFTVVLCLLTFTGPLLLLVSLVIKCESPGPVLLRKQSMSRGGRRFEMLKFRTIDWDLGRERCGQTVTRVGSFLQYSRIEALPQLINVLRGEMSLIEVDGSS